MSEFEKMTDDEINDAIARTVMGWKRGDRGYWDNKGDASDYRVSEWSPSTSLDHAAEMEAKIITLGLAAEYGEALLDMLELNQYHREAYPFQSAFDLATAPSRTRCIAALSCMETKA